MLATPLYYAQSWRAFPNLPGQGMTKVRIETRVALAILKKRMAATKKRSNELLKRLQNTVHSAQLRAAHR